LASSGDGKTRTRREYRPTVEGLEALRLLSSAAHAHALSAMIAERDLLTDPHHQSAPLDANAAAPTVSNETWDVALGHAYLASRLGGPQVRMADAAASIALAARRSAPAQPDTGSFSAGLVQLNKYLSKTWYRSGLAAQVHDDSTQSVYASLLQTMGRTRFDTLVGEVGRWGIREVFTRETSEGVDFFRAVDMVKKRARREKVYHSLDSLDVPSETQAQRSGAAMRAALQDAIDHALNPREAALMQDTLMGKTPAEIALQWGVAAKTVSNEKSRVLQKLREALVDHELN
jgi:RNA polymerase sigma factor (sigma-70 family)